MRLRYLILCFLLPLFAMALPRERYNFNSRWLLHVGDDEHASQVQFDDRGWQAVTLPHAFNEDEAFRLDIHDLTDTVMWYRKHFVVPATARQRKVFLEFEGGRQGVDCYVNGQLVGQHENGVMAFGFDISDVVKPGKENVIAVRVDNDWNYRERSTKQKYQWDDKNFNANYGGLPKNVWLHVTDKVYQTLPLYSNLGTTGTYVYASEMDVPARTAVINVESQVKNETRKAVTRSLAVEIVDPDGHTVATYRGEPQTIPAGGTAILKASQKVSDLHFWSWGYGYLYNVKSTLTDPLRPSATSPIMGRTLDSETSQKHSFEANHSESSQREGSSPHYGGEAGVRGSVGVRRSEVVDGVSIITGFRKTRFAEGKVWLNDRVLQMKGFAQRTSNEWPAVGMSVPAWLSDYSNGLMVEGNANLVRWMHVTPWKQDIESCDRVGLIQAMQAGDAEKDVEGRRWGQRVELMRDAIIYNRNNPSILFYECGNESISREHMLEMRAVRDSFDYFGGRAIGSREMLDIREAEYGGEMLYINKSAHSPMWAMEYCRDEGLRKYWDEWSYPYHPEGQGNTGYLSAMTGQTTQQKDASAYNHNQDQFVVENVHRWWDYFVERPGTGRRVSSGGAKIIFSDTNTHFRGVENYRRSGDVDPLRIPKDLYFAHQVMWDGWVDIEQPRIHIVGHWNYSPTPSLPQRGGGNLSAGELVIKPVYVVSNTDSVALFLNGKPLPGVKREWQFLFTFPNVKYEPGELVAVGYNKNQEACRTTLHTAGTPHHLQLTAILNPLGWKADGADLGLVQVEVMDQAGRRCPLANDTVRFTLDGPAEWRGGLAQGEGYSEALGGKSTNWILCQTFPVECGVNRALLRSRTQSGTVTLRAEAPGLEPAVLTLQTQPIEEHHGLSSYIPSLLLPGRLGRGATPSTPSYQDRAVDVEIASVVAGANQGDAQNSYDDNELSEWKNDGRLSTAWITYNLARMAQVDEVCLKLTGWRMRSYPLEIYADDELVWSGQTERSLGYVHIPVRPRMARSITIRLKGAAQEKDAFGQVTEVAAPAAGELDLFKAKDGEKVKSELRIVEVELKERLQHGR